MPGETNVTTPHPTLPPDTWVGGGGGGGDGVDNETERLKEAMKGLDVTVWLMILCIFTFFFFLIAATLCMTWLERRRMRDRGEMVVVPGSPVPGCVTVYTGNQPHLRLLSHYHTYLCPHYGTKGYLPMIATPRSLSAPELPKSCCGPLPYVKH